MSEMHTTKSALMRLVELQQGADLETVLRRLHCLEELPMHEVGKRLGIPGLTAGNWIRKFRLDRRSMARKRAEYEEERAASGQPSGEALGTPAAPARSSVEGDRHDSSAASRGNRPPSTDDVEAA